MFIVNSRLHVCMPCPVFTIQFSNLSDFQQHNKSTVFIHFISFLSIAVWLLPSREQAFWNAFSLRQKKKKKKKNLLSTNYVKKILKRLPKSILIHLTPHSSFSMEYFECGRQQTVAWQWNGNGYQIECLPIQWIRRLCHSLMFLLFLKQKTNEQTSFYFLPKKITRFRINCV